MAFDGVLLSGIVHELNEKMVSGKVEKVYQPEKDEIHINLRCRGKNHKLLLSASASHPRIHITEESKSNPLAPPMFCMVLRKHLTGSRVISVSQPSFERIAVIAFEAINELGDLEEKQLIIEIMGRHSNIILVDQSSRIIDSIKHVNESISRIRQVLPGMQYTLPPLQDGKTNPLTADISFLNDLMDKSDGTISPVRFLTNSFIGVSKVTAEEIVYNATDGAGDRINIAGINRDRLSDAFFNFFDKVKAGDYTPVILKDEGGKPRDILPFYYKQFSSELQFAHESFGDALDIFYSERDLIERTQQRTASLTKLIKTNLERCEKKLRLQQEEIIKSEKAEEYKIFGELLTANLHTVKKGVNEVSVYNYYDSEGKEITIPLNPTKTPVQNAQSYYKKYNKAKTALIEHKRMLEETKAESEYLESILEALNKAVNEQDVQDIREELANEGYVKRSSLKRPKNQKQSKPYYYVSSDDFEIYVGKNNLQNDYLTLRFASGNDIWLHTKTIPGSHVIIKSEGRPVPESTLLEAASLAAYYSKGRLSSNVPVDYCPRKNVKKPGGAKPGMVIYDHYNTIYVTPTEESVQRLTLKSQ